MIVPGMGSDLFGLEGDAVVESAKQSQEQLFCSTDVGFDYLSLSNQEGFTYPIV